jgi:uncharacterized membrane protein
VLLLVAMFALAAATWGSAPDRIPVHYGFDGRPDRWGGRFEGLFAMPLTAFGVYVLMLLFPRIDPGRANYEAFAGAYATLRLAIIALLAAIQGIVVLAIRGGHVDMEKLIPILVGALLMVVGNVLGKVRPNWFVGIRTPWTLSSKRSWVRTHRLGGWLFVAMGAAMIVVAALWPGRAFVVVAAVGGAGVLALIVYSYVVWRNDPDKVPPAGTLPA